MSDATDSTTPGKVDFQAPYSTESLRGRSALVTGGAEGIGKGCAVALAEAGAYVTIVDIDTTKGEAVERELTDKGLHVQFVQTDVTSYPALCSAFRSAISFPPSKTLDIVIPAAGLAGHGSLAWLHREAAASHAKDPSSDPPEPISPVLKVNFLAVFNTVHLALHHFRVSPGTDVNWEKHIVLVCSQAGYGPMRTVLDYSSSKWGIRGLFWSLRGEDEILGQGEGVPKFRCNMIAPTFVRTNMVKPMMDRLEKAPGIVLTEISDVVKVVMRMCADQEVKGRAAAIGKDSKSFDLCDDFRGSTGLKELENPEQAKAWGWRTVTP